MRTLDQQLNYENLELIARPSSLNPTGIQKPSVQPSIFKQAASVLQNLAAMAMRQLTHGHEPRIWTSSSGSQITGELFDVEENSASIKEYKHFIILMQFMSLMNAMPLIFGQIK